MKPPTYLNPVKDPTSDTESLPSPSTSPVMSRRPYGDSITTLGKASILGTQASGPLVKLFYKHISYRIKLDIAKGSKGHIIMEPKPQVIAKDPRHVWMDIQNKKSEKFIK